MGKETQSIASLQTDHVFCIALGIETEIILRHTQSPEGVNNKEAQNIGEDSPADRQRPKILIKN